MPVLKMQTCNRTVSLFQGRCRRVLVSLFQGRRRRVLSGRRFDELEGGVSGGRNPPGKQGGLGGRRPSNDHDTCMYYDHRTCIMSCGGGEVVHDVCVTDLINLGLDDDIVMHVM